MRQAVDEACGVAARHRIPSGSGTGQPEPFLRIGLAASDPVTAEGVTAYLRAHDHLVVLSPDRLERAQVGLLLVADFNDTSLASIERLNRASGNPRLPVVVVADSIGRSHLMSAVGRGLVCYLPRSQTSLDAVVQAAFAARAGQTYLPQQATRLLVDGVRAARAAVERPVGSVDAGLSGREADILASLADGLSIAEIAAKLNYSERTIKYALQHVQNRLKLRNRVHAVAHAVRAGFI
jgi:DNA-binding NarL/FixJ family response regulator